MDSGNTTQPNMKKIQTLITVAAVGLVAALLTGCYTMTSVKPKGSITSAPFGTTPDGKSVEIYTLTNSHGMEARIMTYGGIVVSLKTPDRKHHYADVVLGFDSLDGYTSASYLKSCPYFGALIGRYGNRIAHGKFMIGDNTYNLAVNNGVNSLHGGVKGFDKVVWTAKALPTANGPSLILTYVSPAGEEGYPGNLAVTAVYSLTEDNALTIDFSAHADQKTVVNLTHHSYFNLRGSGDILSHVVYINADKFTPVDAGLIPTGILYPVDNTPFDFRTPTTIGARIGQTNDTQIARGNGYDHNWVLNRAHEGLCLAAEAYEPTTGRLMEVWTTQPGVQFYSGNFLDGTITGKGGHIYNFRNGFCFEPQHFPDSPNHPAFPTTLLNPGEIYKQSIVYKFSAK
jgi:aldose 1-epimerase